MLSEIFLLRLEAIIRTSSAPPPGRDTRWVPIKSPVSPDKEPQQATK
jgi:hypothetical protein